MPAVRTRGVPLSTPHSPEGPAVGRLRQTLPDAWKMIRPYWFSEDRWPARGLPALSQSDARDSLAPLAHRTLPPRLAGRRRLLSYAARRTRDRQPRPAHCRGHSASHLPRPRALHWRPARRRHPGNLRGDPLGPFRTPHRLGRRPLSRPARLHGMGLSPVRPWRHLADRLDRSPPRTSELRSTAV